MKTEKGVMVMLNGKAWGIEYNDGRSTSYGWISPEDAILSDPRFLTEPWHLTYRNSPYIKELQKGKIINVERRTEIIIEEST
jgi:hypothetical protein